ncbi:MAG: CehA/McbA family metallohydrolase [bacterium]
MTPRALVRVVVLTFALAAACDDGDDGSRSDVEPLPPEGPKSMARRILDESDLIGGPRATGRVGDYLLANDKIRLVIQDVGRDPIGFVSPYGGNIVDADLVRGAGEPDNDQFMAMSPQINIESTFNATSIEVVHDGADGEAAVIRARGVDDCLDYINASQMIKSMGGGVPLSVPDSADDVDILVEIVTEYSLRPGDDFARIETFIKNVGQDAQGLYFGDYIVNSGGETDLFVPGSGFGEPMLRLKLDFIALRGEGGAQGLTYGYVPEIVHRSTAFTQTGVTVTSLGTNAVALLLLGVAPSVEIPPSGVFSYVRWFVVARDMGAVQAVRDEIFGFAAGTLKGRVTVAGAPLAGAAVAAVQSPGDLGAPYKVMSVLETDADGQFQGPLLAGSYGLMVSREGYPYDSGSSTPGQTGVSIAAGQVTEVALALPPTGRLRVRCLDEAESPVPGKVTLVGFDPSPVLDNPQSLLGLLSLNAYVFDDPGGESLFGLAKVLFLDPSGDSGEVSIEPGQYELFASRGPEYSLYQSPVEVVEGVLTEAEGRIARVVDTTGFVSGDFHVHMINSPDSKVPEETRVRTFLAEGVDYLVASDHEYLTDLRPTIQAMGAQGLITTSAGQEITPQDYGHYNAFPMPLDPSRRSMGALDWAREAPPGQDYRTLGAYCMAPGEIFEAARALPGERVVQVNHFNSGGGAGFNILGFDTGQVPPASTVDPAPFRLDPAIENLFSANFDALEMLIGNNNEQVGIFFNENLGDWFNLLNQGLVRTGSSDSDTHDRNVTQAGTFRNFIASSTDSPGAVTESELVSSVRDGRIVGGYSPFLTATVQAESTGETGGLALGLPTLVSTTDGSAGFRLEMASPVWIEFDRVELYINHVPEAVDDDGDPATPPQYRAAPDVVLRAGDDFERVEVVDRPELGGAAHFEAAVEVVLEGLERDTWIVAVVRGTEGVSRPLFPVVPNEISRETNASLADLLDGNLGEGGMLALSFTNPLFVDVDGNGRYDAPQAP